MRIAVVGGGIVGLAVARQLHRSHPGAEMHLFEKEAGFGRHQSTHNSGVLHAGLFYKPGSQKAKMAVSGIRQMIAFCQQHRIAHEICGKLVIATTPAEVERLRNLHARGTANGLTGLLWLDAEAMREVEPHAAGLAGLRVPEEGLWIMAQYVPRSRRRMRNWGPPSHQRRGKNYYGRWRGTDDCYR